MRRLLDWRVLLFVGLLRLGWLTGIARLREYPDWW